MKGQNLFNKNSRRGYLRKITALLCAVSMSACLFLSGCGAAGKEEAASVQGSFFDTQVAIRVNGENAEKLADACLSMCSRMQMIFSAQDKGSELYQVNHRKEQSVQISDDLAGCIKLALKFCEASDGALDITILPVSDLWDFRSGNGTVPEEEKIRQAVSKVDYRKIHLNGNTLKFDSPDTMIDLGSIAKGYVSGKIKNYLKEKGCRSALIDLGRNISTVGTREDGSEWKIGLQKPFSDSGELIDTVRVNDQCVISSGTYERYFKENGKLYHHILDANTGYPADTQLNMATVIGTEDASCDALSTVCILLGKEKSEEVIRQMNLKVKVMYTDTDNQTEWFDHLDTGESK